MTGRINPSRPTTVYRLFDEAGRLLYVGTSANPQSRWEQHAREKLWWSSVTRATVEWCASRPDALAAEREAIRSERPLHNNKATPEEEAFPYQGNRGPSAETRLRRAGAEARGAMDRLAIAVNSAVASGLSTSEIAATVGLDEGDIAHLATRVERGGGRCAIADRAAAE